MIEVADSMGWESHIVRSELNGLQYNDRGTSGSSLNGARSTVLVEFSGLAFHVRAPGDFMPEERDHICEFLAKKVKGQEEREVEKLHLLHAVLQSISQNCHFNCERNDIESESRMEEDSVPATGARQPQSTLQNMIHRYFSSEGLDRTFLASSLEIPVLPVLREITPEQEQAVRSDIHSLAVTHGDLQFTGRTVARIFHGIASPLFPAEVWGRQHRFWRKHLSVDFNTLCQIATVKLLELR
jgi:ATP-dependent DNA helicase Q4